MKKILLLLIISSSLLGITDASYITWEKFNGVIPPCNQAFQCGTVLESRWANIGPLPISALGIVFYATFFILAVLTCLDVAELKFKALHLPLILLIWGGFGALFSLYLVTIMGLVLHAWCLYCLLSAANCLLLLTLSAGLYSVFKKEIRHES